MCPMIFCLAAIFSGVDVGWQPLPDGGVEYIIQISPEAVESLQSGQPIQSDIPPDVLREIRSYRVIVGHDKLPRKLPLKLPAERQPTSSVPPPAALPPNPASKPLPERQATFVQTSSSHTLGGSSAAAAKPDRGEPAPPAEKPWMALWLTVVALFTSLGGNLFLGWITWDARNRYRTVLERPGH